MVMHVDRELYSEIAKLRADSDVVVLVAVGDVVAREVDTGGNPLVFDEDTGLPNGNPLAFHGVEALEMLAGELLPSEFAVATFDAEMVTLDSETDWLESGQTAILFLRREDRESAPGITAVSEHFSLVGGPQGILEVEGDVVRPRVATLDRLDEDEVLTVDDAGAPSVALSRLRTWFRGE